MKYFLTLVLLGLCNPAFSLGVRSGQVTTSKIAAGSVTTPKLHIEALDGFRSWFYLVADKLGLGITPSYELDVLKGDNGSEAIIRVQANNQTAGIEIGYQDIRASAANQNLVLQSNGTGDILLNSTQGDNVGIGTASPSADLDISGDSNATTGITQLQVNGRTTGEYTSMGFGFKTSAAANSPVTLGSIETSGSGSTKADFFIATRDTTNDNAPTVRMTIEDGGNVGIGTASPGTSLDVNGIATSSGSAYNSQNIIMPDTGDGATSDLTFTPNMGRQRLFCQDANGCVMTFGETAVANGTVTTIINVQATGNTTLTYGAGVALLQGGASWTTMNANDVITLIYNEDAWYEMSRSVN